MYEWGVGQFGNQMMSPTTETSSSNWILEVFHDQIFNQVRKYIDTIDNRNFIKLTETECYRKHNAGDKNAETFTYQD